MTALNESLFYFFYQFALQDNIWDASIIFAAEFLPWVVIVFLIIFTTTHAHTRKEGFRNLFVICTAAATAWGVAHIAKWLYVAPRPFIALSEVSSLIEGVKTLNSFPSGHATFFASIAASVFAYHRWTGLVFILAAIIIGIARVAAGVHFPIDILGGWVLGGVIGYIAFKLYHVEKNTKHPRHHRG